MNSSYFVETIINVLKFDGQFADKKEALLPLIRRSVVNFLPQYEFAYHGRSGQRYENVEIRLPIPLLNQANELQENIRELISYVYEESNEYALGDIFIKPKIISPDEVEYKEHDVVFSEIQDTIIQGIRDAKYSIWAAVAWVSNKAIISELVAKKRKGLNVRLIISEEENNRLYYDQLAQEFDLVIIPHFGWNDWNRMHDKFCIIDFEYVMHGSYNWTTAANYNDETLSTALDRDLVKKFADEFINLYGKGHQHNG